MGELRLLRLDDALLSEAAAVRPRIKSLDALHLASARRIWAGAVTVLAHDAVMAKGADALGFDVFGPVG